MKHLKIEYTTESGSTITLYDQQVTEVTWTDGPNGIRVEGKTQATATGGGMGGLLEMLAGASKSRTAAVVEEKRAELATETAGSNSFDLLSAAAKKQSESENFIQKTGSENLIIDQALTE